MGYSITRHGAATGCMILSRPICDTIGGARSSGKFMHAIAAYTKQSKPPGSFISSAFESQLRYWYWHLDPNKGLQYFCNAASFVTAQPHNASYTNCVFVSNRRLS